MAAPCRASPKSTPVFSVVIALFNKQPWIRRALDSIAAQEFPAAEVIVVNDGSTDGGDEVARAWGDARLRVIDQPNGGVGAACNTGIAAASQSFVAFLDADDEWSPAYLGRMQSLIERHPGAVLYGAGYLAVGGGHEERRHHATTVMAEGGPADFFREVSRGDVVHRSSTVVPRSAALAVGGFPVGVPYFEDYVFWLRLALSGPVVLLPEPLVRYDVAVPGQALAVWQERHAITLDPTALDRFLADELRRRTGTPAASPEEASFLAYARGYLARAMLKRAYWGRFDEVARFGRELRLDGLRLGWPARAAGWVARHPAAQPAVRAGFAITRAARQTVLRGLRRPPV